MGDNMVKQVAFFDIAGTIVAGDPWKYVRRHPSVDRNRVRMTVFAFLPVWFGKRIGLLSDNIYRDRWLAQAAGLFKGWNAAQMDDVFKDVALSQMKDRYHDAVVQRIQQHKAQGDHVVLVSGMFEGLSRIFAQKVGADEALGTRLRFSDQICVGKIEGATIVGPRKLERLKQYLAENFPNVHLSDCYAYADSYSDLPMLSAVGHGVAVYPDEMLENHAREHQWEMIYSEKESLLE